MTVGIVDYGCGNLFSLISMFDSLGVKAIAADDAVTLYKCDKVVLPGVGAFGAAVESLRSRGLMPVVNAIAKSTPMLGICLGMQLLFDRSYEYGINDGLGIVRGEVKPIPQTSGLKIPHMGWNALNIVKQSRLLKNISSGEYVYFVHSYCACDCDDSVVATVDHGTSIVAAVERGHVFGTQFHPEKSGETGLKIMRAFMEI